MELADMTALEAVGSNPVGVQLSPPAHIYTQKPIPPTAGLVF